jgi:putative ABC transport system permease protein
LTFPSGESRTYTFSGVIRDLVAINAPFFIFDDEMTQSFNSLALELKSGLSDKEIFDASNAVDDAFLEQGINLRNRTSVKMRMLSILNHLDPTFMVIKILGITTVILGLLGLLIVLNLTLQERTREIGVMKSIGAPFGKISNLFKQEFLLMSLLSILLGGLMSIPLAKALINLIAETIIRHPVPFRNDFSTVAFSTLIILVIQVILISIYNQLKIGKNARELMDHNF